jgi:hypothetical protein
VGLGGQRPQRGPPEDELPLAIAKKVGEIRVAAGELLDDQRPLGARETAAKVGLERGRVALLVRA